MRLKAVIERCARSLFLHCHSNTSPSSAVAHGTPRLHSNDAAPPRNGESQV